VRYAALTPNMKGYEAARAAGADEVAIFGSASEGFSRANINATIAESLARFAPVMEAAQADRVPVRGYVSCVIRCPYDGPVSPQAVAEVGAKLMEMGCFELSLGDTIGAGTPETVAAMLAVVAGVVPPERLAGHFHDTGGLAVANIEAALAYGVRVFDAAAGGLGGCPFAPGAPGNVDTLRVAERLAALGWETGLDLERLRAASGLARSLRM
jgi:hydroxymethylglutaryl-CoA lyase